MLKKNMLILNTTEKKLLWGIFETLQEIKGLLQAESEPSEGKDVAPEKEDATTNTSKLKRGDIVTMMSKLPADKKPDGWITLTNDDLLAILQREGVA